MRKLVKKFGFKIGLVIAIILSLSTNTLHAQNNDVDDETAKAAASGVKFLLINGFSFGTGQLGIFYEGAQELAIASIVGMSLETAKKSPKVMSSFSDVEKSKMEKLLSEIDTNIKNGVDYLITSKSTKANWGRPYAILYFLNRLKSDRYENDKNPVERKNIESIINKLIKVLEDHQNEDGGWDYTSADRSVSPLTAIIIHSLIAAKNNCFGVDQKVLDKAKDGLNKSLFPFYNGNEEFTGCNYFQNQPNIPDTLIQGMKGTQSRNASIFIALQLLGEPIEPMKKNVEESIRSFSENKLLLEKERDRGMLVDASATSRSLHNKLNYNIAPYYYSYGYAYAASAMEFIGNQNFREDIIRQLLVDQNMDGSWSEGETIKDYPTAFALLSLLAPVDTPLIPKVDDKAKGEVCKSRLEVGTDEINKIENYTHAFLDKISAHQNSPGRSEDEMLFDHYCMKIGEYDAKLSKLKVFKEILKNRDLKEDEKEIVRGFFDAPSGDTQPLACTNVRDNEVNYCPDPDQRPEHIIGSIYSACIDVKNSAAEILALTNDKGYLEKIYSGFTEGEVGIEPILTLDPQNADSRLKVIAESSIGEGSQDKKLVHSRAKIAAALYLGKKGDSSQVKNLISIFGSGYSSALDAIVQILGESAGDDLLRMLKNLNKKDTSYSYKSMILTEALGRLKYKDAAPALKEIFKVAVKSGNELLSDAAFEALIDILPPKEMVQLVMDSDDPSQHIGNILFDKKINDGSINFADLFSDKIDKLIEDLKSNIGIYESVSKIMLLRAVNGGKAMKGLEDVSKDQSKLEEIRTLAKEALDQMKAPKK